MQNNKGDVLQSITSNGPSSSLKPLLDAPQSYFTYTSLDDRVGSIRLVDVQPARYRAEQVQCVIRHTTNNVDYRCISYVWGSAEPRRCIKMNGKNFWVR
ncbi:hypothetical protein BDV96DRAFT_586667 [Lophiotrema nucula]|uniref:Heterokaryon incompatibility domain-containing protein n=1 Tax=Lophiotrema nucula TaxID=690887 RepID=A0A6A5YNT1_9PLEO|nr:hypothetical protein BDV96DRAFT_586667 [Lophiotrema nucula]